MQINTTLPLKIESVGGSDRVNVEFDADRFERLASDLGLFTEDFLSSLQIAEKEIKSRKTKVLNSLAQI